MQNILKTDYLYSDTWPDAVEKINSNFQELNTNKTTPADVNALIQSAINALKWWATSAYDTLVELQQEIQANDWDIASVLTTLGNKANLNGGNTFSGDQSIDWELGVSGFLLNHWWNKRLGIQQYDNWPGQRRIYFSSIDENWNWLWNVMEFDNFPNSEGTRYMRMWYFTKFMEDVSLENKMLYIRGHWDNYHWIKYNNSLDWPEMWGYFGASLWDRNNHQIMKAYQGRAYLWQSSGNNNVIIHSSASNAVASSQLNSLGSGDLLFATENGHVYFYTKDNGGTKRAIVLNTNGTVNIYTI